MMKLVVLSGLVLSASCMVLHQPQIPLSHGLQYYDTPNYNFAYEVNDAHTGDVKSQHESRRGETVLGQYTLLQPDGIRRTVDYRADEHAGFLATVNNVGQSNRQAQQQAQANADEAQRYESAQRQDAVHRYEAAQRQQAVQRYEATSRSNSVPNSVPANLGAYAWPAPTQSPTPAPAVAVSRSSIVQTFSHGNNNPWL